MRRELMNDLIHWKASKNRKPLILRGARQVGKTWLMNEFGRKEFADTVYINFDREHRLHEMLQNSLDPGRLISALGALAGKTIVPENTLIILDEIQEEPRALAALKYFCEEKPEYPVIAAGSLLGVALHEGTSFPVGKVTYMDLFPMNFREFLDAEGKTALCDALEQPDMEWISGFGSILKDELRAYCIVGGMPEAVLAYTEHKDFVECRRIQEQLLYYYQQDFSKHAPLSLANRLRQVWNSIPAQLSKENRKYIFGQVVKGGRAKDFELALQWLSDCGLIHMVHRVTKPGIPLKTYEEMPAFKVFLSDIGLLGALGELPISAVVDENRLFTEFKGAFTEQYVLQQLLSVVKVHPYYYSAENSRGKIDFLIQMDGKIVPLEVKAAENLQAKSLKAFVEKFDIRPGVRISMSEYREQDWMVNYPLYAFAELLRETYPAPSA